MGLPHKFELCNSPNIGIISRTPGYYSKIIL